MQLLSLLVYTHHYQPFEINHPGGLTTSEPELKKSVDNITAAIIDSPIPLVNEREKQTMDLHFRIDYNHQLKK